MMNLQELGMPITKRLTKTMRRLFNKMKLGGGDSEEDIIKVNSSKKSRKLLSSDEEEEAKKKGEL